MSSAWEPRSGTKVFASVRLRSDTRACVVVIEPVGSEYELGEDDELVVELMSPSLRPEDTDIEIVHGPDRIEVWTIGEWRAWNRAGDEIL